MNATIMTLKARIEALEQKRRAVVADAGRSSGALRKVSSELRQAKRELAAMGSGDERLSPV
jgi:hypothetical protein